VNANLVFCFVIQSTDMLFPVFSIRVGSKKN